MSWLKKSAKKLGKSVKKIGKKVVKNPLAAVLPTTYFSNAGAGAGVGALSGGSASEYADKAGTVAAGATIVGGAALAGYAGGAELLSGTELGTVTDGVPLPSSSPGGALPKSGGFDLMGGLKTLFTSRLAEYLAPPAEASAPVYSEPVVVDDGLATKDALIYAGLALAALVATVVVIKAAR